MSDIIELTNPAFNLQFAVFKLEGFQIFKMFGLKTKD